MEFVIFPYVRKRGEQVGRAGSDPQRFQVLMVSMASRRLF